MAGQIENPVFRYTDNNGDPLNGGKVYFYIAGTSTLKDTYSDYALTTANTNPVILDSRGEAQIYGSGQYKVVVKDSSDNTIETMDNVTASQSALDTSYNSETVESALTRHDGFDGLTAMRAGTVINQERFILRYGSSEGDGLGGIFRGVTGAGAGTYSDDAVGVILPDSPNDGTEAFLRQIDTPYCGKVQFTDSEAVDPSGTFYMHRYEDSAPASGTFVAGSITWNTTPTTDHVAGWCCETAGTPGTWRRVGDLYIDAIKTAYDPASIADGASVTTTVTVTGAEIGDFVEVSFSQDLSGLVLTGYISAADTATVVFANLTGGAVDLGSGNIKVRVRKQHEAAG